MFRNLMMFRFAPLALSVATLQDAMDKHRLREIGPLEVSIAGFVPPYRAGAEGEQDLVYATAGSPYLVAVGVTEKLLPAAVVEEHLSKRIQAIASREGRRIGAKERKRLKDEVLTDLLPRAFTRQRVTLAYLDFAGGWLVVDTASRKAGEQVVSMLRQALGSFAAVPCAPDTSPRALLTSWLTTKNCPLEFTLGDECELRDPADGGGKWVGRKVDLESGEVLEHLKAGMQVFRVGLTYRDWLTCSLCEDLTVRKFHVLDGAVEESVPESQTEAFAAEFTRLTLEVRALLTDMAAIFAIAAPSAAG